MRTAIANGDAHRKIGQWLKEKREQAGLTQTQLAGEIGRHRSFVVKYEAGRRMEIMQFVVISRVLKADPREGIQLLMPAR